MDENLKDPAYINAKKIVDAYESNEPFNISFWFMLSNHTFKKLRVNNLDNLIEEAREAIKLDGYGMLCQSRLSKNNIEMKSIGKNSHVSNGIVNIEEWVNLIKKDLSGINYIIDNN
jgi:hypothetical protein